MDRSIHNYIIPYWIVDPYFGNGYSIVPIHNEIMDINDSIMDIHYLPWDLHLLLNNVTEPIELYDWIGVPGVGVRFWYSIPYLSL